MGKVVIAGLILSVLPIWRRAGIEKPLNFWEILSAGPMEHISVEEALGRARKAGYI